MAKAVKKIITRGVSKKNFPKILIIGNDFNTKILLNGHEIDGITKYKIEQKDSGSFPILILEIEALSFEYHTEGESGPINIQYYDVELNKMVEITNVEFKEKITKSREIEDQENHNFLDGDMAF